MTDEQVAMLLCEEYDRAKTPWWIDGIDDRPDTREPRRVAERWTAVVRETRHQLESSQREQTAATILAALIQFAGAPKAGPVPPSAQMVAQAARLADALRTELSKPK